MREFAAASFAVSVIVDVPPEAILDEETATSVWERDKGPGLTVIVGSVLVTELPPMVLAMEVADPA